MSRAKALMVQGTTSDAGKSVLTAAFCRMLQQDGYKVAPFKAQNMSNNAAVTAEGGEIGRAQATQAAACKISPNVLHNPLLIKPHSDTGAQLIVMGQVYGSLGAADYMTQRPHLRQAIHQAYDTLAQQYDVIVLEGAGSPAEVNLRAWDMVNMSMAHHAQASVQIVGDIDRGGVYAHFVGTHACLEPADQVLIHGFLVNRFRGDASLLDSAHTFVQQRTQVPIRGVIPWIQDLGLPDEDSVSLRASRGAKPPPPEFLDLVLLDLPCLSNQSDFDILAAEPGVCVRVVREVSELGQPDAVLIPGSKSVLQDLASLRQRGLDQAILQLQHTQIVGICGGLQMLGTRIVDGVENTGESTGLGLLDLHTVFAPTKTVRLNQAWHQDSASKVHGYEIHHGQSTGNSPVWLRDHQDQALGFGDLNGSVWGTYLHGIWDNNLFRHHWLEHLRRRRGLPSCSPTLIRSLDQALDDLADTVRNSVDWLAICQSAQI